MPSSTSCYLYLIRFCYVSNTSLVFAFSPGLSAGYYKQESFIKRVLEIPFEQRKWKGLVNLDTLHAFCGGPMPMPIARRLHAYTRRSKLYPCSSLSSIPSTILNHSIVFLQKWAQADRGH